MGREKEYGEHNNRTDHFASQPDICKKTLDGSYLVDGMVRL